MRFDEQGNNCCFTVSKKYHVGMYSDVYESIFFNLGTMIDDSELNNLKLITRLTDLDLDSRSQECKKVKTYVAITSQSYQ